MNGAGVVPAREPALVSVVIVVYNARRHLSRCVGAVLAQSYPRVEILVVDNASSDGSADEVAARFPQPQVRLVRAGRNLGYAGGNNLGFAHARGDYVAVLNPDTEVESTWLAALVEALEADPAAGLATSKILLFDRRDRINTCGNDVHYTGLAFCRGLGCPATAFTAATTVPAVSGAAFLIRRDLLLWLGGFDERFFLYLEDTDLSWRAALAGFACLFVPDSVVYHHYAVRIDPPKTFYLERNRYLLLLQNCRWATLLLLLPALLLTEVLIWGYVLLRGRAHIGAKLGAYRWLLGRRRQIVRSRRRVQRLRRAGDRSVLRRLDYRLAFDQVAPRPIRAPLRLLFDAPFRAWQRVILAIARW